MTNFPESIKCNLCPRGIMYPSRVGLWHQYYLCNNIGCKNVTGLPFSQNEEKKVLNDFGSGAYRSERSQDES